MTKRILSGLVFVGILLSSLACLGGAATEGMASPTDQPPTVVPTEKSGIQLAVDGSGDYPDLETAVAEAEVGETINLAGGTYRLEETLVINKSITLIGVGYEESIIVSTAEGSILQYVGSGLFTLKGITVQHEGSTLAHVVLVNSGEVDFSECHLTGAVTTQGQMAGGFLAIGNATGSIKNCLVDNNSNVGIVLGENANFILEENICENNIGVGILFKEHASGEVRNNKCNQNEFAGFYLSGDGEIFLSENICSQNGLPDQLGGGILVSGTATPTLEGNICTKNPRMGIAYSGTSSGKATHNDCSENGFAGIYLEQEAAPTLESNTCNQNGTNEQGAGIIYFNQSGGVARENIVTGNIQEGIFVGDESTPELIENNCSENGDFGIQYAGSPGGSATKNQCASNGQIGILVKDNASPLLEENICFGNQAGIYIIETANPTLVDNDLYDNIQDDLVDLRP